MVQSKTGFSINPKDWSSSTNRPIQNSGDNKLIFSNLLKLESFLYEELNKSLSKNDLVDLYWLKDRIKNCFNRINKNDSSLLTTHVQYIIANSDTRKVRGTGKIGLSKRRVLGYKSFLSLIKEYEDVIGKKITFLDINKPFVNNLVNWLINTKEYSTNYAGKIIDNLKTVSLDAKDLGIEVNQHVDKIESFTEKDSDRLIITLSFDELKQIENTELDKEYLNNARNWLLLGCETGQRAGDLLSLTYENVRFKDGHYYIDLKQQKTGKDVTVIILSQYLIDTIKNDFPSTISQQKLNEYIKIVCKKAGITQKVKGKKYDKESKRKKIDFYPKYQLITSHCFRRSFATNYYKKIPTPILINITGHSKESLFLKYINRPEDKDENAKLFAKFYNEIHQGKLKELELVHKSQTSMK